MKSATHMSGVVLLAAALLAVAPTWAHAQEPDLGKGADVYGATCGRCHNPRSPVERSDREWIVIINHMRVRANLTGDEARDVLAFLMATNGQDVVRTGSPGGADAPDQPAADVQISSDPADVQLGMDLSSAKGCVGCHVVNGAGGQIGPALNGVVDGKGAPFVQQKLSNPAFDNPGTLMPNLQLTPPEIVALIAYLATLR